MQVALVSFSNCLHDRWRSARERGEACENAFGTQRLGAREFKDEFDLGKAESTAAQKTHPLGNATRVDLGRTHHRWFQVSAIESIEMGIDFVGHDSHRTCTQRA